MTVDRMNRRADRDTSENRERRVQKFLIEMGDIEIIYVS
jgi:hypothetical protein